MMFIIIFIGLKNVVSFSGSTAVGGVVAFKVTAGGTPAIIIAFGVAVALAIVGVYHVMNNTDNQKHIEGVQSRGIGMRKHVEQRAHGNIPKLAFLLGFSFGFVLYILFYNVFN